MKKRFLIIQTAFIGDVILATPVINNLLSNIPDLEIDVLVKKENVSVLQGHKGIHQIYCLDKSRKMSSSFELIRLFRKNKYDTVINLHRFASSGIITTFSGAKQKIGFDKNPFSIFYSKKYEHVIGDGTHEVDRNLRLISQWVTDPSRRPDLKIDENENENTHDLKEEKYICLAPASVWATKEAPLEVWIKTIQNTSKEIKAIYLLGAPSDTEKCEGLAKATKHKQVINLCGKLNLRESASLMKDAAMNYVNDSAPLHLASSVNAPVTVFFCSTSPSFGFGPLSSNSSIIEVRNLDCKPCGLHGHKNCPKGHFRCGKELLN
ncbi:MAG: glycosyltransferase family 9 protein [Crocinitomicaceae bacterium]|jgi:heptosyltransferase-2|tara:strand:+ start:87 stop:1049 length:963 start_codon:yes stop_codon:yes gene_type:complete